MKKILTSFLILYALVYPFLMLLAIPKGTLGLFGFALVISSIFLWNRSGGITASIYASLVVAIHCAAAASTGSSGSISATVSGIAVYLLIGFGGGWFVDKIRRQNKALAQEITMRTLYQEKLSANESKLSNAMKIARMGAWTFDLRTDEFILSDEYIELIGYVPGEIARKQKAASHAERIVLPEDAERLNPDLLRQFAESSAPSMELSYRVWNKDGKSLDLRSIVHRDPHNPDMLYGTSQDLSDIRSTEKSLQATLQQLGMLNEALDLSFLVTITDPDGRIIHANERFCEISGYTEDQLIGRDHRILNSGHHSAAFFEDLWRTIEEGRIWRNEVLNRSRDGSFHWLDTTIIPLSDENGALIHYVAIRKDVTQRKTVEEQVVYQAYHDHLTGLPNRRMLYQRLTDMTADVRPDALAAVLLFDLDNFKLINDSLGHLMGDELLKSFTGRVRHLLSADEMMARIGGDEFVILLPALRAAEEAEARCTAIMTAINEPFQLGDHPYFVTASAGISLFPTHGTTVEQLLKAADMAMYGAKGQGKNASHLFRPEMDQALNETLRIERNLRKALQNGEFSLLYQPVVRTASGELYGVEALIRWESKELGHVPPGKFIPLAENFGLLGDIFDWVLRTACLQGKTWRQLEGAAHLVVNLNISPRQFRKQGFAEDVLRMIEECGANPDMIHLEITEDALLENPEENAKRLHMLKKAGISISIDDFGTGFSSLYQLKSLPIDHLKIDRVFLKNVQTQARDLTLMRSIVELARNLGLEVVAEGVETSCQLEILQQIGCEYVQGYYISYPLNPDVLTEKLRSGGGIVTINPSSESLSFIET